jgi:predicted site-specific integrase-resolvase
MNSAEVCERLGDIDRSTLSRWVLIGRITPAYKHPGVRGPFLFDPDEVERVRLELTEQATA